MITQEAQELTTLADGQQAKLMPDIPFADYTAIPAVNVSSLLNFLGRTDRGAKWAMEQPREETPAQLLGHALHAAVLEPETFARIYCTMPAFGDLRTKAGREARDEWQLDHAGQAHLTAEQHATVVALRDNILNTTDPQMKELFAPGGQNELTLIFRDEPTGLLCKGRVDRIAMCGGWPTVVELKTTRFSGDYKLGAELAERNYHVRLAWYMDALNLVKPADWRAVYVWCETGDANEVRMTESDDAAYAEGRAAYRHCLERYARCTSTGSWPSYPHGVEIINPPRWAFKFTSPEGA